MQHVSYHWLLSCIINKYYMSDQTNVSCFIFCPSFPVYYQHEFIRKQPVWCTNFIHTVQFSRHVTFSKIVWMIFRIFQAFLFAIFLIFYQNTLYIVISINININESIHIHAIRGKVTCRENYCIRVLFVKQNYWSPLYWRRFM